MRLRLTAESDIYGDLCPLDPTTANQDYPVLASLGCPQSRPTRRARELPERRRVPHPLRGSARLIEAEPAPNCCDGVRGTWRGPGGLPGRFPRPLLSDSVAVPIAAAGIGCHAGTVAVACCLQPGGQPVLSQPAGPVLAAEAVCATCRAVMPCSSR